MQGLLILGSLVLIGGIIYTFVTVGKTVPSSDNKAEMQSAINTVLIVNTALILIMGAIAFAYIAANPTAERTYMFLVTHAALLLSVVSVGISMLQKLDVASRA